MSIIIDKEFQSLIPPLTPEELQQLEENCVKDGIRDALIVWKQPDGNDILIDGHNRWNISIKHGGIPFQIKRMDFPDRDAAKLWIIDTQLGRRNVNLPTKIELSEKKRAIIAEQANKGGRPKADEKPDKNSCQVSEKEKNQIDRKNKTDYKVAQSIGTSEDTYRKGRVILNSGDSELITSWKRGDISTNQGYRQVKEKEMPAPIVKPNPKQEAVKRIEQANEAARNGEAINFQQYQEDKETVASKTALEIESGMNRLLKIAMFNKSSVIDDIKSVSRPDFSKSNFKRQISDCIKFLVFIETRLEDW